MSRIVILMAISSTAYRACDQLRVVVARAEARDLSGAREELLRLNVTLQMLRAMVDDLEKQEP